MSKYRERLEKAEFEILEIIESVFTTSIWTNVPDWTKKRIVECISPLAANKLEGMAASYTEGLMFGKDGKVPLGVMKNDWVKEEVTYVEWNEYLRQHLISEGLIES